MLAYRSSRFLHFQHVHFASFRPVAVELHVDNIVSVVLVQRGLVLNGEGVVADRETVRPAEVQHPVVATPILSVGPVDQPLTRVEVDHPVLGDDGEVRIV